MRLLHIHTARTPCARGVFVSYRFALMYYDHIFFTLSVSHTHTINIFVEQTPRSKNKRIKTAHWNGFSTTTMVVEHSFRDFDGKITYIASLHDNGINFTMWLYCLRMCVWFFFVLVSLAGRPMWNDIWRDLFQSVSFRFRLGVSVGLGCFCYWSECMAHRIYENHHALQTKRCAMCASSNFHFSPKVFHTIKGETRIITK